MKVFPSMEEINPTKEMVQAAQALNEGPVVVLYKDGNTIRMETRDGDDPYVWRDNKWHPMKNWMGSFKK